ncbi:MAG: 16S rRNA (guanine(527)-N(7))-methyltransferase RsmG [Proteobacteria bacterium]|nr:16S rRNA (guanine(527)-N(7))-methyltransferase RsmG [Pseudomonadota bacterium]
MEKLHQEFLAREAERLGVVLRPVQLEQFSKYLQELKAWNKKVNLTSLRDDLDILIKHFLDSLLPVSYIPRHSSLLDIGSGAGFPGIPLKIAEPTLFVTLLDSTRKKVFFERHLIRTLGLDGIEALHGRAEDLGKKEAPPVFDVIISRALYSIEKFQQVSEGCIRRGGRLIILTTPHPGDGQKEQVREGFRWKECTDSILPLDRGRRRIILLEKI